LNKFAKKHQEKGDKNPSTFLQSSSAASSFFGRKKSNATASSSSSTSVPGSIKQGSFCGAQLPPVWATPLPPAPKQTNSAAASPEKDQVSVNMIPGPRNAAGNLRSEQFNALLKNEKDSVDLDKLRELSWGGIPVEFRPLVWKLLLSYIPPHKDRREAILQRKRQEYSDLLQQYYFIADTDRGMKEQETLHQV